MPLSIRGGERFRDSGGSEPLGKPPGFPRPLPLVRYADSRYAMDRLSSHPTLTHPGANLGGWLR
jgi:hypothetical protein